MDERGPFLGDDALGVVVALRAGLGLGGLAGRAQQLEDAVAGLAVILVQRHRFPSEAVGDSY